MHARAALIPLLVCACKAPAPNALVSEAEGVRFTREEVLAGVAAPARHAWVDPEHEFRVESDYSREFLEPLLALEVHPRLAVYREVFGVEDLSELVVRVHDRAPLSRDAYLVNGFHVGDEVHVFAGLPRDGRPGGRGGGRGLGTLAHELVHAIVSQAGLRLDRWFEEGLCEVLADVRFDSAGTPWIWPDPSNEARARLLLLNGTALSSQELVRYREGYPDENRLPTFYVQAESFTSYLLGERAGPLSARIEAVRALTPGELREADERWRRSISELDLAALHAGPASSGDPSLERATLEAIQRFARTPAWWEVAAVLASSRSGPAIVLEVVELLRSEKVGPGWWRVFQVAAARLEPDVRRRVAELLLGTGQDEEWWAAARVLLADADPSVRRAMRHVLVLSPEDRPETWRELAAMRIDERDELRLASALAVARLGEPDAAVTFLAGLAALSEQTTWVFDLAQLQLAFPAYPAHPDLGDVAAGRADLPAYASAFASWKDRHRDELLWRPHARRYSLRPAD